MVNFQSSTVLTASALTRRDLLEVAAVAGGLLVERPGMATALGQTSKPADPLRQTSTKIRLEFNGASMTATLYNNPSSRDFASMLPLDLTIEDYSTNEKIAYLPRKLSEDGDAPFDGERPGDLGYYAPWGNLALFYAGYRYSSGLIRLGRIDGDLAPLRTHGKFDLHIALLRSQFSGPRSGG